MQSLYLICGGNGAGKTTFYRQHLFAEGVPFVNADEIARQISHLQGLERDQLAWRTATDLRDQKLKQGETFAYETVFSHPSKLELIRTAQQMGYTVNLFFIFLDPPSLHERRVKLGFQQNERHDVASDKINGRLPRVATYVPQAIRLADEAALFDNSSASNPFRLAGRYSAGRPDPGTPLLVPDWLAESLSHSDDDR